MLCRVRASLAQYYTEWLREKYFIYAPNPTCSGSDNSRLFFFGCVEAVLSRPKYVDIRGKGVTAS
jgi:hypothetical protein